VTVRTRPRRRAAHGLEIEDRFGYSQGIEAGGLIHIAGQVPRDAAGLPVARGAGLAPKWRRTVENVEAVLEQLGRDVGALVYVQAHVTDDERVGWGETLELYGERLGTARPAATVVQVRGLNDPEYLVEISAVAAAEPNGGDGMTAKGIRRVTTGHPIEERLGRPQAVRAGGTVHISGQLSVDERGEALAGRDFVAHYELALANFRAAVAAAGATLDDVVSMHFFVSEVPSREVFARATDVHRELFQGCVNRPASTMVAVAGLAVPEAMVEVAGVAVVDEGSEPRGGGS
jgi:enamine deaminase RidA (YjgF/YER057c/UK114 family)